MGLAKTRPGVAFVQAFRETLGLEGGYVNDPDDPGGETIYGISKRSYPDVDIAGLTTCQAMTIYRRDYWDALDLDKVSNSIISGEIFDTAVNMGRKGAVVIAQKALNFLA